MLPFESYPGNGRRLLGQVSGDNCRKGYCLKFQKITGQRRCAYCGVDMTNDYYSWLLMNLDHVIPKKLAESLDIPNCFWKDYANRVLACSGCNTFLNRDKIDEFPQPLQGNVQNDEESFFKYRDAVFMYRHQKLVGRRMDEMNFFDTRPWEDVE